MGKYIITRNADEVELCREWGEKPECKYISPAVSLQIRNHSPTGFEFGYYGSGPAQLALAIMYDYFSRVKNQPLPDAKAHAQEVYQDFKAQIIAKEPPPQKPHSFEITFEQIEEFLSAVAHAD